MIKKQKIAISFFLAFIAKFSIAQIYTPISFPEVAEKSYLVNPIQEEKEYTAKLKGVLSKKQIKEFAYSNAYYKSELFNNAHIYFSWKQLEDYLNSLLKKIEPMELAKDSIHVYVARDSEINAYCLFDGTMIVNTGLIAEVKSEAALVAIMGHELAHYIKQHHINSLKKEVETNKIYGRKTEFDRLIANSKNSQADELEADEVGFELAKKAGYDLRDALSNFEMFAREEEFYKLRNKSELANTDSVIIKTSTGVFRVNTLEKLLSSHPDIKDRSNKLSEKISNSTNPSADLSTSNKSQFNEFREQARLECLSLLMENHYYQEGLERAFVYYLYRPNEINYAYYCAETIRRLCLFNYRLKKKGFLTEQLVNNGFKEGEGILHDLKFIIPDVKAFELIDTKHLLFSDGKAAFENYKDAFNFYTNILVHANLPEAYLQRALFSNNDSTIKWNINAYLNHPKSLRKEYAKNYLENNLVNAIATFNKEVVIMPKVEYYSHRIYGKKLGASFDMYLQYSNSNKYYAAKSETKGVVLATKIADKLKGNLRSFDALTIPKATVSQFNTRFKYESALRTSFLASREENEGYVVEHYFKELIDEEYIGKLDVFRLDPSLWYLYYDNQFSILSYAEYTQHTDLSAKMVRNIYIAMILPSFGIMAIPAIFKVVNYKELELYSYDPKVGVMYHNTITKKRKLNKRNSVRLYKKLKRKRENDKNTNYNF